MTKIYQIYIYLSVEKTFLMVSLVGSLFLLCKNFDKNMPTSNTLIKKLLLFLIDNIFQMAHQFLYLLISFQIQCLAQ
jgi:hypothetical protein